MMDKDVKQHRTPKNERTEVIYAMEVVMTRDVCISTLQSHHVSTAQLAEGTVPF